MADWAALTESPTAPTVNDWKANGLSTPHFKPCMIKLSGIMQLPQHFEYFKTWDLVVDQFMISFAALTEQM